MEKTPEQMRRRKIVKRGFQLCLMVCGRSGTGKSTFINTLCEGTVFTPEERDQMPPKDEMTIRTRNVCMLLILAWPQRKGSTNKALGENDGTTISLTVVDTPGFGDNIDNSDCCKKILEYLEHQFDEILAEENRVKRNPKFIDNRVHVCLYFIAPTGRGLRELDIDLMMTLSQRVNIIPVIAKADTLTADELVQNKTAIMRDIQYFKIPIYFFPCDDDDAESQQECVALRELVPFAIVGSNENYKAGGGYIRGRQYPWGFVRIEDPDHSDFVALRSVLFGSHIAELREITHDVHYENYRAEKLSDAGAADLYVSSLLTLFDQF
jgi:cell division control protein 11